MFSLKTYFDEENDMYHLIFDRGDGETHELKFATYENTTDEPYYATDGQGCNVRTLGIALDMDYNEIYDLLHEEARFQRCQPNKMRAMHPILKEFGFHGLDLFNQNVQFLDLVCDYHLDTGVGPYVVVIPQHMFCIENGIIYENILNYKEDPYADQFRYILSRLLDPINGAIEIFYYHNGYYFA